VVCLICLIEVERTHDIMDDIESAYMTVDRQCETHISDFMRMAVNDAC
jgi:hypothetical protein